MARLLDQLPDTASVLLLYLADELPAADRAEVEQALANDRSWREELERVRAAHEAVSSALAEAAPAVGESAAVRRAVGNVVAVMREYQGAWAESYQSRRLPAAGTRRAGLRGSSLRRVFSAIPRSAVGAAAAAVALALGLSFYFHRGDEIDPRLRAEWQLRFQAGQELAESLLPDEDGIDGMEGADGSAAVDGLAFADGASGGPSSEDAADSLPSAPSTAPVTSPPPREGVAGVAGIPAGTSGSPVQPREVATAADAPSAGGKKAPDQTTGKMPKTPNGPTDRTADAVATAALLDTDHPVFEFPPDVLEKIVPGQQ